MKIVKTLTGATLLSFYWASSTLAASGNASVLGIWRIDSGKVTIRIGPCGQALCGVVVGLKKPLNKKGLPKVDKDNPNPALRNRPIMGLTILMNMRPDGGDNNWVGTIYNADDGNTYTSYMKLQGNQIKVKGCFGPICKSKIFDRVN